MSGRDGSPGAAADLDALRQQVMVDVQSLQTSMTDMTAELGRFPFFVRGMVEKELSAHTDLNVAEWEGVINDLVGTAQSVPSTDGVAALSSSQVATLADDLGRDIPALRSLRDFLAKIPSRMGMVPGPLLPAAGRQEFLGNVQDQIERLDGLIARLPTLASTMQQKYRSSRSSG